jgi:ElaB/YqjD/DUF883 family membrane-anchored ribosome-binding protein
MNDRQFDNKVRKDVDQVKKDVRILVGDGTAQLSRIGAKVDLAAVKAREDLNTWVEDCIYQLGDGLEKLTDDAKERVVNAAAEVKKGVGHGLSQYDAKAREVANIIPGGFGKKAARYPWVSISIALVVGLLLGGLLKPARHYTG